MLNIPFFNFNRSKNIKRLRKIRYRFRVLNTRKRFFMFKFYLIKWENTMEIDMKK